MNDALATFIRHRIAEVVRARPDDRQKASDQAVLMIVAKVEAETQERDR